MSASPPAASSLPNAALSTLPPSPEGVNPFAYWSAIARRALQRAPSNVPGFDARQIILCILLIYLLVAAFVALGLTAVDYRRRGKAWFFWKTVRRERGRYIVGNQQILEPILTIAAASVFLAHTIVEWQWTFGKQTYAVIAPLRLATWSILFVQLWIVSWASLQSFVITAGEGNIAMRYFSSKVANTTFVGLGTLFVIFLIIGISYGARESQEIWDSFVELQSHLLSAIPVYPAALDDTTARRIALLWARFVKSGQDTSKVMQIVVIEFAVSASLTALANIGGIALLLLVRRQISSNYGNFVGAQTQPEFHLPNLPSTARDVEVGDSGEVDSGASQDSAPHNPPPGAFALSITPATPLVSEVQQFSTTSCPDADDTTPSSSRKSSLGDDPVPTLNSGTGQGNKKKKRRPPSRSAVRRIAGNETGGVAAAQARNLQQLHRAESDLFITCCSSVSTSIAFTALSSWVYGAIPKAITLTWGEIEVAIFLGSWLYAIIHGLALTAHLYTLIQNFSRRAKPARNPTDGFRPDSFVNATSPGGGNKMSSHVTQSDRGRQGVQTTGMETQDDDGGERQDPSWLSPRAAQRTSGEGEEGEELDARLVMEEVAEKEEVGEVEERLPVVAPSSQS